MIISLVSCNIKEELCVKYVQYRLSPLDKLQIGGSLVSW